MGPTDASSPGSVPARMMPADDPLPPDLELTVLHEGAVVVVAVRGELDAATVPELDALLGELAVGQPVALDLCECGFMDSTALHTLVDARAAMAEAGSRFAIACIPGGAVANVLEVALPGVFEPHDTRAGAVAALAR
jgi:anti-anti-sigma factor